MMNQVINESRTILLNQSITICFIKLIFYNVICKLNSVPRRGESYLSTRSMFKRQHYSTDVNK